MSKHFISPDWKALRKLPDYLQRAWFYMWDKCDPAGVYEYDEDYMKLDLSLLQAISKLELTQCPEVIILPTGQLFIKNFIEINYGTLKEGYNPHKPTFRSIEKYNLSSFIQASFKLEDEDEDKEEEEGKGEEEDFLKKEGAGEKNFLSELDKSETGKPVSFQKSKWFDKSVFFAEVPQDWPQAKRENYYEAALAWSQDNPKKKKVDWIRAVRLWDNNHPWQEVPNTNQKPKTESPTQTDDITRIIDEFNALTQSDYNAADEAIRGYLAGRLMDGCQLQEMLDVIALKAVQWGSGDSRKYLKFHILFKPEKYPGYVQEVKDAKSGKIKVLNPNESRYDRIQRKIDAALGRTQPS